MNSYTGYGGQTASQPNAEDSLSGGEIAGYAAVGLGFVLVGSFFTWMVDEIFDAIDGEDNQ